MSPLYHRDVVKRTELKSLYVCLREYFMLTMAVSQALSKELNCYIGCACYRKDGEPPLIKGWIPFLGKALEFRKNSLQFLTQLQQEHGDVFTVLIAGIVDTHIY